MALKNKPKLDIPPSPSKIAWKGIVGLLIAIIPIIVLAFFPIGEMTKPIWGRVIVATALGLLTSSGIAIADRGRLDREGRPDIKDKAVWAELDKWNMIMGFLATFIGTFNGILGIIPAILTFYKRDLIYFWKNWRP